MNVHKRPQRPLVDVFFTLSHALLIKTAFLFQPIAERERCLILYLAIQQIQKLLFAEDTHAQLLSLGQL